MLINSNQRFTVGLYLLYDFIYLNFIMVIHSLYFVSHPIYIFTICAFLWTNDWLLLQQGHIRFGALILDFDKNTFLTEKLREIYKTLYYWLPKMRKILFFDKIQNKGTKPDTSPETSGRQIRDPRHSVLFTNLKPSFVATAHAYNMHSYVEYLQSCAYVCGVYVGNCGNSSTMQHRSS